MSAPWPEPLRADDGIRTRDPHLGKVMLYQLSHVRASHLSVVLGNFSPCVRQLSTSTTVTCAPAGRPIRAPATAGRRRYLLPARGDPGPSP